MVCAKKWNGKRSFHVGNGHERKQMLTMRITVTGTLKGYDQLMNLVLDDVKEITRGMTIHHPNDPSLPYHFLLSLSPSLPIPTAKEISAD